MINEYINYGFGFLKYVPNIDDKNKEKEQIKEKKSNSMDYPFSTYLQQNPRRTNRNESIYLETPMYYDFSLGEPVIDIDIGNKNQSSSFRVILDTGSTVLLVSGAECEVCPRNKGIFKPNFGQKIQDSFGTITYNGGQKTDYELWNTQFPQLNYANGIVGVAIDSTLALDDHQSNYQIKSNNGVMTGSPINPSRHENLLGLNSTGFIQSLPQDVPRSVIFDFPQGQFIMGKSLNDFIESDLRNRRHSSLFKTLAKGPSDHPFIVSPVHRMTVDGVEVPKNISPQWVLFDTGSTRSVYPKSLYQWINKVHPTSSRTPATVTFDFEVDNTVSKRKSKKVDPIVTETIDMLLKNEDISIDDPPSLPIHKTILLGNRQLKRHGIGFEFNPNGMSGQLLFFV